MADSDWEQILQVNLLSVAKLSARLLPLMRVARAGRIINIGSVLSLYGAPLGGPYVVSKHALLGHTRTQAFGVWAHRDHGKLPLAGRRGH